MRSFCVVLGLFVLCMALSVLLDLSLLCLAFVTFGEQFALVCEVLMCHNKNKCSILTT